jgi:hypothetical protein
MAFHNWEVSSDETFTQDADPVISRLKARKNAGIHREAGAQIVQDIALKTYWANTSGKTKFPSGVYHMYLKELKDNMECLMKTRMAYMPMEEFLVSMGYESGDIRNAFTEHTGLDPVKLEYMRSEDVKNTPSNIPWYNLGWGWSKKSGYESYFVMPYAGNVFTVFGQKDDMQRDEVASFLRQEEALEYIKPLVKKVHRYDMDVSDQIVDAFEDVVKEPEKKEYMVYANYFYDLRQRGELDPVRAKIMVNDAVRSGSLTEEEGQMLIERHADVNDSYPSPQHTDDTPDNWADEGLADSQKNKKVEDELDKRTPQDFFDSQMPDKIEEAATNHIKSVFTYISHRNSDMNEFKVSLHSLEYMKHKKSRSIMEVDPQTGRPAGPPNATISALLEIKDNTLPDAKGMKFCLAVFFVNPDGEITTSDSLKGEDDIIYGFSEDGLRQYFAKERGAKAEL